MDYPTAEEVGEFAKQIVIEVMAPRKGSNTGSDKSGPGEWYTKDWIRILTITSSESWATVFQRSDLALARLILRGKLVLIMPRGAS